MINSRIFILLLVVFFGKLSLYGQDPIYSQYYNAPLQLNPAFAGNSVAPIVAINYRNQWPSWPQAYSTYSISYDQYFPELNSGWGLFLLADDAGDGILKSIRASGIYSYKVRFNKSLEMKIGLEASFTQTRLDWNRLLFPDQIDYSGNTPGGTIIPTGELQPDNLRNTYFDFSTGMLLYSPQFYAGLTLKHLNSPDTRFLGSTSANTYAGLPMRISLHAGTEINFSDSNNPYRRPFLSPNILVVKQSDLTQINLGSLIGFGSFYGGLWYRHTFSNPDAVIFSAGVRKGVMKFSYSFDMTISSLQVRDSGGAHEIGIILNFDSLYSKGTRYNDCFNIFR